MSASTKLSTAVKALCYLAEVYPAPKNSTEIAENIGVNASKLRKLLSYLGKDEIVVSTKGSSGGFLLNKAPAQIHLQAVYCAIEDRKAFHLDVTKNNGNIEGRTEKFNDYFLGLFDEIQVEIEEKMTRISLVDVMNNLEIINQFKQV
ncbi:MAG: hypothetical protein SCALA702_25800 [Melioribacteraceae bacterium]|nr:MAG: hypothetical protein SCALA702_25800 [Melioribacteraceae bacterium]